MKCAACGYEDPTFADARGDEPLFVKVGRFDRKQYHPDGRGCTTFSRDVYACPKCGTLKVEV
jgi:hypothetical protein